MHFPVSLIPQPQLQDNSNKHCALLAGTHAAGKGTCSQVAWPRGHLVARTWHRCQGPQRASPEMELAVLFVQLLPLWVPQRCQVSTGPEPPGLCVCAQGGKALKNREGCYPQEVQPRKSTGLWSSIRLQGGRGALPLRWSGSWRVTSVVPTLDWEPTVASVLSVLLFGG